MCGGSEWGILLNTPELRVWLAHQTTQPNYLRETNNARLTTNVFEIIEMLSTSPPPPPPPPPPPHPLQNFATKMFFFVNY